MYIYIYIDTHISRIIYAMWTYTDKGVPHPSPPHAGAAPDEAGRREGAGAWGGVGDRGVSHGYFPIWT